MTYAADLDVGEELLVYELLEKSNPSIFGRCPASIFLIELILIAHFDIVQKGLLTIAVDRRSMIWNLKLRIQV